MRIFYSSAFEPWNLILLWRCVQEPPKIDEENCRDEKGHLLFDLNEDLNMSWEGWWEEARPARKEGDFAN